jgi:hypothetical protein
LSHIGDQEADLMHMHHDAWQAAALLVGLFGNDASSYAAAKMARCLTARDKAEATTWSLISSQIDLLLTTHTDRYVS